MGLCLPCLGGQSDDYDQPSPETRRRQQAEAAQKRQKENEGRGLKDPEGVKRKQQRREEAEKKFEAQSPGEGGLKRKWNGVIVNMVIHMERWVAHFLFERFAKEADI